MRVGDDLILVSVASERYLVSFNSLINVVLLEGNESMNKVSIYPDELYIQTICISISITLGYVAMTDIEIPGVSC